MAREDASEGLVAAFRVWRERGRTRRRDVNEGVVVEGGEGERGRRPPLSSFAGEESRGEDGKEKQREGAGGWSLQYSPA